MERIELGSDACSFLSTGDAFGKHASGSKYGIAGGFRFGHGRFSVKQALVENVGRVRQGYVQAL